MHNLVTKDARGPGLAEPPQKLPEGSLGLEHEILVAADEEPLAEMLGLPDDLPVHVVPVPDRPLERGPHFVTIEPTLPPGCRTVTTKTALGQRRAISSRCQTCHGVFSPQRRLPCASGVPAEEAPVERRQLAIQLLLANSETLVPLSAEHPERDELVRTDDAHDSCLRCDADVLVAVEDQAHERRPGAHRADDEDRGIGLLSCAFRRHGIASARTCELGLDCDPAAIEPHEEESLA